MDLLPWPSNLLPHPWCENTVSHHGVKAAAPFAKLGGIWILYLKEIFRIARHKMHFTENLRCLVEILKNAF
jgi:hypothetical protein